MSISILKRRFTVEEYDKMGRSGIFPDTEKNELIEGEIIARSPIGKRHAACVSRLSELFFNKLANVASVRVQNPIILDDFSEPQPDIVLVKRRVDFYEERHPQPSDIFLLVEVADTSFEFDQQVKIPLYCQNGIREVWLINLAENYLLLYQSPTPKGYQITDVLTPEKTVTLDIFPEFKIKVQEILG